MALVTVSFALRSAPRVNPSPNLKIMDEVVFVGEEGWGDGNRVVSMVT